MKYLVVLALVLVSANAANVDPEIRKEFLQEVNKFGKECVKETGATPADVVKIVTHKIPESDAGKCLVSCMYKKFKIQKEDGTMNHKQALKLLDPIKASDMELYSKLETVILNCQKQDLVVDDHCTTALNMVQCAKEEASKIGVDGILLGV